MSLYDLSCIPEALHYAAEWVRRRGMLRFDVTLTSDNGALIVRQYTLDGSFAGARASGSQVEVTSHQLLAAARWATPGDDMAPVELLADDRMLLVTQGDDRAAFDTGGEPASEEYLAVAPLDRNHR